MTMQKIEGQSPEAQSADIKAGNIAQLKALFPELLTESANGVAVNVDVLKQLVGDAAVTDAEEKYGLNWHGKRRARQIALTPSTGTLRPCPDESVDWDTTQNLMIEGDNLEVLKLLQKSYAGKVKMIYIDPPYNRGKDFVYPDNFQDNIKNYLELTGQVESGRKISSNSEANGRFHTDWLNMMYSRLKLARNLLREDGVIFISIDDAEVTNLHLLASEVFGEENMLPIIVRRAKVGGGSDNRHIAKEADYIIGIARDANLLNKFFLPHTEKDLRRYSQQDEESKYFWDTYSRSGLLSDDPDSDSLYYEVKFPDGSTKTDRWRRSRDRLTSDIKNGDAKYVNTPNGWNIHFKQRLNDDGKRPRQILPEGMGNIEGSADLADVCPEMTFSYPKPVALIKYLTTISATENEIILDFFAGSGTTGHAVMAQNLADGGNRRYILVQLPEPLDPENKEQKISADFCDQRGKPRTIAELTKERLRCAGKKIKGQLTTENPEKNQSLAFDSELSAPSVIKDVDTGFRVFKLDTSNIRAWNPDRDNLAQTLLDHEEHILSGRTEGDIVYELLLKLGLDLCVPIESRTIAGKTVGAIGAGVLLACLAERITTNEVEALAQGIVAWRKELAPAGDTTCVFRDSAFENDIAKSNLAAILEQHGISNVRSL